MTRPILVPLDASSSGWLARFNDNFSKVLNGPFPIGTVADLIALNATYDPKLYKACLICVESEERVYQSNGTSWVQYRELLDNIDTLAVPETYDAITAEITTQSAARITQANTESAAYANGDVSGAEETAIYAAEKLTYESEHRMLSLVRDFSIETDVVPSLTDLDGQSVDIGGTRTSSTIFTRSSGTWSTNELVDKWIFAYASGSPYVGSWLRVVSNTTTAVTITGSITVGFNTITTSDWGPDYLSLDTLEGGTFVYSIRPMFGFRVGAQVSDGTNLWMVPFYGANVAKVDPNDASVTLYAHGQGTEAYVHGVFDGTSVWLVPQQSANITKVNISTGGLTHYAHGQGSYAYIQGIFDGTSVWLIPYTGNNITKVNISTGGLTHYAHGEAGNAFSCAVLVGDEIWIGPNASSYVVKINTTTGTITKYAHGMDGTERTYSVELVGTDLYFSPGKTSHVLKINTLSNNVTLIAHGQGTSGQCTDSVFDGRYIWMSPNRFNNVFKIDTTDDTFSLIDTGGIESAAGPSYGACVFDGIYVWILPCYSYDMIRIDPATQDFKYYNLGKDLAACCQASFIFGRVWMTSTGDTFNSFRPIGSEEILTEDNVYELAKDQTGVDRASIYPGAISGGEITTLANDVAAEEAGLFDYFQLWTGTAYAPGTPYQTIIDSETLDDLIDIHNDLVVDMKSKGLMEATP